MSSERIADPDKKAALRRACAALKVFPLYGAAILPGTPTPFHIFEPRYRQLVEDALSGDRMLAVPALLTKEGASESKARVRPVCGAGFIETEQRYPDGRFDIVLRCVARVRLMDESLAPEGRLYREFRADLLEDLYPEGGPHSLADHLAALRQIVYDLSLRLPTDSGAPHLAEAVAQMKDPSGIVDLVTAAAISDAGTRQEILEELDVQRRLEKVLEEVAGVVLVLSRGKNPSA